jgi:hypothetical protein
MPWLVERGFGHEEEVYFASKQLAQEFILLWVTYFNGEGVEQLSSMRHVMFPGMFGEVLTEVEADYWEADEVSHEDFDEQFRVSHSHHPRPTIYTSAETAFADWKTNPFLPMGCPNGLPGSEKQAQDDPEAWLRFVASQESLTSKQAFGLYFVFGAPALSKNIISSILTRENSRKLLFIAEDHDDKLGGFEDDRVMFGGILVLEEFPISIIDHYKTDILRYIDNRVFDLGYEYFIGGVNTLNFWTDLCEFFIKNFPETFAEYVGKIMVPRLSTGEDPIGVAAMLGEVISLDQTILVQYANKILEAVNEMEDIEGDAWSYLENDKQCPDNQKRILLLQYWLYTVTC